MPQRTPVIDISSLTGGKDREIFMPAKYIVYYFEFFFVQAIHNLSVMSSNPIGERILVTQFFLRNLGR